MHIVGKTLGKFRIEERLGRGSMSVCYRAVNTVLDTTVALKVLAPELRHDALAVSLFHEKAQAVAGLNHPNIVMVYDLVVEEDDLFVVMEYVHGQKLSDRVEKKGPLALTEALRLLIRICDALSYAHEKGVIHYNLRPHNIILEPAGSPVIIDFGMVLSDVSEELAVQERDLGRLRYKSPEEILHEEVDFRTDLWSLGVTAYYLLTARYPFDGVTAEEIRRKILSGQPPPPPSAAVPSLPKDVDRVLLGLLLADPERRQTSFRELKEEFLAISRHIPDPAEETKSLTDTELFDVKKPSGAHVRPRDIGHYRLLSRKGVGSFAIVYMAEDQRTGRIVALKLLKPEFEESENVIERFRQEAEFVRRIRHPNVVEFYEFGVEQTLAGRRNLYFTMEYIEGPPLKELILPGHPLPIPRALSIARQAALGLSAAHGVGVIHRDLKPANILLDKHGRALITDFGIAVARSVDHRLTATGQLLGTYAYMSPEQARGEEVTPVSDLYSLGVILYEMVTGDVPFKDNAPLVMLKRIVEEEPPEFPPHLQVPEYVRDLVRQLLKKTPAERFQSAVELADCLSAILPEPVMAE